MELYQLNYFWVLCRHRHFTRAAEALYITPPALTTAIKKMEAEIGRRLIDRTSGEFVLTEVGDVMLEGADRILNEMSVLQTRIDNLSTSPRLIQLCVDRAIYSNKFFGMVTGFSKTHPNVEVSIFRCNGAAVRRRVLDREVSIGITIRQPWQDDTLTYSAYKSIEYGLFFHSDSEWAKHDHISAEMLDTSMSILNYAGDLVRPLRAFFAKLGVTVKGGPTTIIHNESIMQIIDKKLGVAILPLSLNDGLGNVTARSFDPPFLVEHVFVQNRTDRPDGAIRNLMDYLITCDQ